MSEYADSFGLSEEVLKEAVSKANFPIDLSDTTADELQGTADFLKDNELISGEIKASDHVEKID